MNKQALMPPIRYSSYINAPPQRVYEALTKGEEWSRWFTTRATIDARPGGSYEFYWDSFGADLVTDTLTGPVLQAEPNRVFAFKWKSGLGMTTVTFNLEPRGDGTIVQVVEEGYSFDEKDVLACLNCAAGWGEALTLLKYYVEHGVSYGKVPKKEAE